MFSKFVIILVVLKVGASTSPKDRFNDLHEAFKRRDTKGARDLVRKIDDADISCWFDIELASDTQEDWNNEIPSLAYCSTALNLALIYREEIIAIDLLSRRADISVADKYGNVPLHLAFAKGLFRDDTFDKIMNRVVMSKQQVVFNHKNGLGKTPLHMAVPHERQEVLIQLLDEGANPMITDNEGNTALHLAIERRDSIINIINAAGSAIVNIKNQNGETALHRAVLTTHVWAVDHLLKKGADPMITDIDGNTALHIAIDKGRYLSQDIISNIINAAGSIILNTQNEMAGSIYTQNKKARSIIVNTQNKKGETALHMAVSKTQVRTVYILLKNGASRTIMANGKTALDVAMKMEAVNNPLDVAKIVEMLQNELIK